MPGFKIHITGSTIVGVAYGAGAWYLGGIPPETCVLAAGLCSVSGMLPDLDSGPVVPLRESCAFAAAVVPMLMIHRFHQMGFPLETMILVGAAIYLTIRFGVSTLLKRFAIHRGMFHSLPAALIAGEIAFLAFSSEQPLYRYFICSAVVVGFLSHLILDEIWSVKLGMFGPSFKKSFGTALKFAGPTLWSNVLTYVLAGLLGIATAQDAAWSEKTSIAKQQLEQASRTIQTTPTPWVRR